jgi:F420-non-reducing hydrogenase large subunit
VVPGGFSEPMLESERREMLAGAREQLEFAKFAVDFAKQNVFYRLDDATVHLGEITTGFMGTVNPQDGAMNLHDGVIRLMRPEGSFEDFTYEQYSDIIGEHIEPWSYGKMPYARSWSEGFSMDLQAPKGIYRANTLARINVCEGIGTPLAQVELEEFRARFGRPAQSTMLYHWARMVELLYACERVVELLEDAEITDPYVRDAVTPKAGRGVGCVEAPRGTLIHDYSTDDNGCITHANLIVGTTHNIAPMNMSVKKAALQVIQGGKIDQGVLNKVEMAVRAYDP